jgi:hypothetical protein
MIDFEELRPGSPMARLRGCTCRVVSNPGPKLDPACPMHGVATLKRMRRSSEGRTAIERFLQHVRQQGLDEEMTGQLWVAARSQDRGPADDG